MNPCGLTGIFQRCGLEDEVKENWRKSGSPDLIYLSGGSAKHEVCWFLAELKDKHDKSPPHLHIQIQTVRVYQ